MHFFCVLFKVLLFVLNVTYLYHLGICFLTVFCPLKYGFLYCANLCLQFFKKGELQFNLVLKLERDHHIGIHNYKGIELS